MKYIGFSVGQQWEQWSITNLHKTEDTPYINAFVSRRSIATVASRKHYQNQRMKSQRRPTAFTSTRSSVELSGRVLLSTCIRKTYFSREGTPGRCEPPGSAMQHRASARYSRINFILNLRKFLTRKGRYYKAIYKMNSI